MSQPFTNPFFQADMSKLDMSKLFDMSKISSDLRIPQLDMEAVTSLQRKNIEAYTAMGQAAFESFQSLWRRQADIMRQMMEETAQTIQSMNACATPEEKVIKQAEASKSAIDKCLANVRDVAETVAKCNTQALDTVSTRMNEGLDELRDIIKTNRAA